MAVSWIRVGGPIDRPALDYRMNLSNTTLGPYALDLFHRDKL
ncbi:MAG TPA: hypothetical protein VJ761_00275 [Ktedonobacteraceae bacterium]|nr:hypothetical protein [Ktedonobacteraceae bacterium]